MSSIRSREFEEGAGRPERFPSVRSTFGTPAGHTTESGRDDRDGHDRPDGEAADAAAESADDEGWEEVRLPALGIILDPQARAGRRLVWLLLLALSVAALVYSVHERLGYLFANPIQMNVKLLVNRTLYFPDLTLCNRNAFNLTAVELHFGQMLRETGATYADHRLAGYSRRRPTPEHGHLMMAALVGHRNRTAADVWRLVRHRLRPLLARDQSPHGLPECFFGRGVQCFEVGRWREVVTVDGVCWTYHNNNSMKQTGAYNHLYMQLIDTEPPERQVFGTPGFQLLLHEPRDDPRLAVHVGGLLATPGQATDAEVLLEEVRSIPRPRRPCRRSAQYALSRCEADCFSRVLLRRAGCALPFMSAGRPCSTPETYRRAVAERERLLRRWSGARCRCLASCDYVHYDHIVDKIRYERPTARTRVFYNHLFFERRAEEFSYSTWKMICDIGGSLGWTCSASILTVFEIADVVYAKYRARHTASRRQ
ncbi:acid-sensing ion channel 2-like [Amphibalanus amphitrite]|uniref:acid-sensing ion channel 2-like n=1 Tax=Amphibalanus amphitrite TaxID=1232801 RepID=UPI001C928F86|nr:acid-sensing ion channel 2-like [Amphibalanus amphitrite]